MSIENLQRYSTSSVGLVLNGYAFGTASDAMASKLEEMARVGESQGCGKLRHTSTPHKGVDGFDLVRDKADIQRLFPHFNADTRAILHVRKAGFVNAKALIGFYMDHPNVQVVRGFAKRIIKAPGTNKIESVAYTETENGKDLEHIHASKVVIAVGPMLKDFLAMNDIYLPKAGISLELHARVDFNDFKGYIPENAPFSIWSDEMDIQLDHEKTPKRYKGGVHIRPFPTKENPFRVTAIWTYETTPSELRFPAVDYVDPFYKEVIFKGLAKAFPNLQLYSDMFSRNPNDPNLNAQVYAGYYCKTRENRPLIGPLAEDQFEGLYITSALSGMGMISSGISGELLAAHMFNDTAFLKYAESFAPQLHPNRYTRLPESYFTSLDATSGQL